MEKASSAPGPTQAEVALTRVHDDARELPNRHKERAGERTKGRDRVQEYNEADCSSRAQEEDVALEGGSSEEQSDGRGEGASREVDAEPTDRVEAGAFCLEEVLGS